MMRGRVLRLAAALLVLCAPAAIGRFTSPFDPSLTIDPDSMAENAKNCMFLYQANPVRCAAGVKKVAAGDSGARLSGALRGG